MAPRPKIVWRHLTTAEQTTLQHLTCASSGRVDRVGRATALRVVARGTSFAQAARVAGFRSGSSVSTVVARFNQGGVAARSIVPGRGRKPTYDGAARTCIGATAQRPPDRKINGTAPWSLTLLQRTLRRDALPRLGASTIRRVLHDAGSAYQRTRSWCPTGTVTRVRNTAGVTVVDPHTEQTRGASS